MPAPNDDFHASAMVDAVRDFSQKLERHTRHGDDERKKLIGEVNATVAAMRDDFWKTTAAIQRDAAIHRDEHVAERKERAVDLMMRTHRTSVVDIWMGAVTLLGVINLILAMYIVFQGR